jgi:hypothetical protein
MAVGNGYPDRAFEIHHTTDEIFEEQRIVSNGQAAFPLEEGVKHTQSVSCFFLTWLMCAD